MRIQKLLLVIVNVVLLNFTSSLMAQTPGFFRDIFSDGGVHLSPNLYLDAAETSGLTIEYLGTSSIDVQDEVMISSEFDSNGHLLYPDGSPRFRMIYTNGGSSTNHGNSLGPEGRDRVRAFYAAGGSYAGSCAGAFITSLHYEDTGVHTPYYHIWPGRTGRTHLLDSYTGHAIPENSPLLNYYDFGSDHYIDNVRHNGGCWGREDLDFPPETEILTRYVVQGISVVNGKASTWAYKPDSTKGRIVVTGSHPESASSGEILNMMQAILLYALDGVGNPVVKANLLKGEARLMNLDTEDNLPAYTRIGDRQYHHFTIDIPPGTPEVTIEMYAEPGFDFNLYANPNSYAFEGEARHTSTMSGPYHIMSFEPEESGVWYIGVECATTVDEYYATYTGQTEVLNGVAYEITASWDVVEVADELSIPFSFKLYQNYPNPFNPATTINYELPGAGWVNLVIYDIRGRQITSLTDTYFSEGSHSVNWVAQDESGRPLHSGIYLYQLTFTNQAGESHRDMRKLTLLE